MRISWSILTLALLAAPGFAGDLENAWHVIRPIIHARDEQKAAAMRSASLVMLAEIQATEVFNKPRDVDKPPEVGGPMIPVIPLHLAKMSAKPLLTMAGAATGPVEFFSWVWVSGKHGGPRLFHVTPESVHILFLTRDSGYLHTVGDYPAYDLEIRSEWVQDFITNWEAGYGRTADLLERIVAVRLKAELESLAATDSGRWDPQMWELAPLTSREFVNIQLSNLCADVANPAGRVKACAAYAESRRH